LSIPGGCLKKIYRAPINWLEQTTTGQADIVFVNSQFTSKIFRDTFPRLNNINPRVLYPSLNTDNFDKIPSGSLNDVIGRVLPENAFIFLSINRYERKKNLGLVLQALRELRSLLTDVEWSKIFLIMAGGYDSRVAENREHFEEISLLVQSLKLGDKVCLLRSPSDEAKLILLKSCNCLVYTPANEHFGIVPLEAMYVGRPVIAVNSGGPTETVIHEVTGLLCPASATNFGAAMAQCLRGGAEEMGLAGRERVKNHFSFQAFTDQLNSCVSSEPKIKQS
jgi:alpha-1,3/alpha-1,6-mannosyltransferase